MYRGYCRNTFRLQNALAIARRMQVNLDVDCVTRKISTVSQECDVTQPFRQPNIRYKELFDYLISSDTLEDILMLFPKFTM